MATGGVPYGGLGPLRQALAEAARTDESNAARAVARFVELRPGIQDTLKARRHHLITGRRGTGKSTLLHVVREGLRQDGAPVAVIDMEKYKGRPFPDVLIEILIALLDEVKPRVRAGSFIKDVLLRREFNKSRKELLELLNDPQATTKKMERYRRQNRSGRAGAKVVIPIPAGLAVGGAGASGNAGRSAGSTTMVIAEFEELKIERLQQLANRLSTELTGLVKSASHDQAVIFIDDFYYVRIADQPDVLNYLQQVVKSTGIWLKIGGVGARMRPYRDGDPPVGMQPDQDIDRLTIDVTLNDFGTAQRFLERMLDGVLKPVGLSTNQLITDTARNRMVLACGGAVARDYVTLTAAALDGAVERLNKQSAPKPETLVNIQAEDVNLAARQRMNKKEEDELDLDAGADAAKLKDRWRDVCDFVREQGNTAFVLFRQKDLDEAAWGDEIRQLENLRLLHRIRDAVPNTPNWRGVKTVVFMVDLGQVAVQRLRTGIPNFWESTQEFDKLRRAEWVYGTDWRAKVAEKAGKPKSASSKPTSPNPTHAKSAADDNALVALTLFDHPSDLDLPS
jgi:hypothetical protein